MTPQEADTARSWGNFWISPVGGGVIFLLLLPTGCRQEIGTVLHPAPTICPDGRQTDLFGWTIGGLVGTIDTAGATGIAFFLGLAFFAFAWVRGSS